MFFKLFLIFTIVPVIELALLIKIGTVIGTLNTIMLVIFTAMLGAYLVKMEGISVITRFQQNMLEGRFPAEELFDGALVLIAGALLVTPGVTTDLTGFLLVIPSSRLIIKQFLKKYIKYRMSITDIHIRKF
ncbi:MAG: FxsA family protein [Deltaproteobacteria bacterium]|nr:FxsA family protein [Deltaproteobacteria bacterium]